MKHRTIEPFKRVCLKRHQLGKKSSPHRKASAPQLEVSSRPPSYSPYGSECLLSGLADDAVYLHLFLWGKSSALADSIATLSKKNGVYRCDGWKRVKNERLPPGLTSVSGTCLRLVTHVLSTKHAVANGRHRRRESHGAVRPKDIASVRLLQKGTHTPREHGSVPCTRSRSGSGSKIRHWRYPELHVGCKPPANNKPIHFAPMHNTPGFNSTPVRDEPGERRQPLPPRRTPRPPSASCLCTGETIDRARYSTRGNDMEVEEEEEVHVGMHAPPSSRAHRRRMSRVLRRMLDDTPGNCRTSSEGKFAMLPSPPATMDTKRVLRNSYCSNQTRACSTCSRSSAMRSTWADVWPSPARTIDASLTHLGPCTMDTRL